MWDNEDEGKRRETETNEESVRWIELVDDSRNDGQLFSLSLSLSILSLVIIVPFFFFPFLTKSLKPRVGVGCTQCWFQSQACRDPFLCSIFSLSLSVFSLSAGCHLLPTPLQCLLFLGCLAHLLKAVASRPCCYYVLTSDLTPTGKKVCGTFWERKGPRTKNTERRREKRNGQIY